MAVFDPGMDDSVLRRELERSGIKPLQEYFDPQTFAGPDDPSIGGSVLHAEDSTRLIHTCALAAMVFMMMLIIFGTIPS